MHDGMVTTKPQVRSKRNLS
jgi:hypothetical protein